MSDWRTHRWGSGRLIRTSLRGFWQAPKSLDAADPSIPNLPIVTPAAPPAGSAEGYPAQHGARSFRRDNQTNRRALAVPYPHTLLAAAVSTDASLVSPFETRVTRSRRQLAAGWMAGMAAQQQAAVIPYPSWSRPVTVRRKVTERRVLTAPALHWQYIAPTIAAILVKPTAKVIEFRRTIQLPAPLALYPPPTGPPDSYPAWAAIAAHRVSQDRRLQAQAAQASYPATSATSPAEFAAIFPTRARRRKSSGMGFVAVDFTAGSPDQAPTTTPAQHPAHLVRGYNRRRDTERRHLVALIAPEFPPTPVVEISTDSALAEPFRTRLTRSRRLLVALVTPAFTAAEPPTTTPAVYPSFVATGFHRRPPRNAGFVAVDGVTGSEAADQPATVPYPSYVPQGFRKRGTTERRPLSAIDAPSKPQTPIAPVPNEAYRRTGYLKRKATRWTLRSLTLPPDTPQTPPVPEQPYSAWKLSTATRSEQVRTLVTALLVPEFPPTPPAPDVPARRGGGRPRPSSRPEKRLPSQYKRLEEMIDEILAEKAYKEIVKTAPAPVVAAAKAVVAPFRDSKTAPVDWEALEADAVRVGRLIEMYHAEKRRQNLLADDDDWMMMED